MLGNAVQCFDYDNENKFETRRRRRNQVTRAAVDYIQYVQQIKIAVYELKNQNVLIHSPQSVQKGMGFLLLK